MSIKLNPRQEKNFFDFFLLPIGIAAFALQSWLWLIEPGKVTLQYSELYWFVGLVLITYAIGYKYYFLKHRFQYFIIVFVAPVLLSLTGVIGLYLTK